MFRSALGACATAAVLVLATLSGTPAAHAVADTSPPAATNASVSPPEVDTAGAPHTLTLTLTIADDLSGFRDGSVSMVSPSGNQSIQFSVSGADRTSGTALVGAYTASATLPRHAEQGVWQATYVSLSDETGNRAFVDTAALAAAGLAVSFTQTGAGDTTAPVAAEGSVTPASVDTSASSQELTFTASVTDDLSGHSSGYVAMSSPSGSQSLYLPLSSGNLVEGTAQSGAYSSTATLPQNAEPGVWRASFAYLTDAAGNTVNLDAAALDAAGLAVTFTQVGQGDTAGPVPAELSVSPDSVDTSDSSQTMTFATTVADDISGLQYGYVAMFSPSGGQSLYLIVYDTDRTSGTALSGAYSSTATLPRYAEHGLWTAAYAVFLDEAGNSTFLDATALDAAGLAASFTQVGLTPPSPPSAPSGVAGDGEVTLTWSAPRNDGGAAITSYTVTTYAGGAVVGSTTTTDTSSTVTGLTNGTAYTFKVTATNSEGDGAPSEPSAAITPATTPGPATIGEVSAGDGEATITFTPPASDGGSPITSYTVTATDVLTPADGGQTTTGAAAPLTVSGLTNGVAYTFTVTATNGLGTGTPSAASDIVVPSALPGAPTGVTAVAGHGTATVTWAEPATTGGTPIVSYTVTAAPGGATAVTEDGTTFTATVTGLTSGTPYTFTVHATNGRGDGPESDASPAVTPTDPPQVPTEPEPEPAPDTGYWLVGADGEIFAFGDAESFGSTADLALNEPIVGMASDPDGEGYWLVAADGGIFAYGDAGFLGSTGGTRLDQPIVGMAATPTGDGYWLVAADGEIFPFGDARSLGSTDGTALTEPIVGMAATPTGDGYWLVAADGGIFAYGDAEFLGSTGGTRLNEPIVGMAATPAGDGYWLVAADGGVFAYGDAEFLGSTGGMALPDPVVAAAPAM